MRKFLRNNGLSLANFAFFFLFLVATSITGQRVYNHDQREHDQATISYASYLRTGHFGETVMENWESEFFQMAFYVYLTALLFQKGSSESKDPDAREEVDEDPRDHQNDPGAPGPVRRGGWVLTLYGHSLGLAFVLLFLISFVGHAIGGASAYSAEQQAHGQAGVTVVAYLGTSQFWFESFQNWQSEFLAVFSIVTLSIFLRQRGSPESKPVHAPRSATGG